MINSLANFIIRPRSPKGFSPSQISGGQGLGEKREINTEIPNFMNNPFRNNKKPNNKTYLNDFLMVLYFERTLYNVKEDLGHKKFLYQEKLFFREDMELKNSRSMVIKTSLFLPQRKEVKGKKFPCVVFCHGNSGNRTAVFEVLFHLLDKDFAVVCFDFTGSGLSDGKYVTLGHFEEEDLRVVLNYVRGHPRVGSIGIWGRSMGGATSLRYCGNYSHEGLIKSLCIDSSFTSIECLVKDFIGKYKIVEKLVGNSLYQKIRENIQTRCAFDIEKVCPLESSKKINLPAIFIHGIKDKIIDKSHTQKISESYAGVKQVFFVDGGHNSLRSIQIYKEVVNFFQKTLEQNENNIDETKKDFKSLFSEALSQVKFEASISELGKHYDEDIESHIKNNLKNLVLDKCPGDVAISNGGTSPDVISITAFNFEAEGSEGSLPCGQKSTSKFLEVPPVTLERKKSKSHALLKDLEEEEEKEKIVHNKYSNNSCTFDRRPNRSSRLLFIPKTEEKEPVIKNEAFSLQHIEEDDISPKDNNNEEKEPYSQETGDDHEDEIMVIQTNNSAEPEQNEQDPEKSVKTFERTKERKNCVMILNINEKLKYLQYCLNDEVANSPQEQFTRKKTRENCILPRSTDLID